MPYLPVDLDAKRKAHGIERALGLPRHTVAGGLTDLWEVVWRDKSDIVDNLTLDEAFGSDQRIRDALVARGFLEPAGEFTHRVRGAAKWLFGLEGKSRGGKAAAANLLRGRGKAKSAGAPNADLPASAGDQPETSRSQPPAVSPALTPSTQHPAPSSKETTLSTSPTEGLEVFEHWQKVMDHPRAAFDGKRRRAVQARLKDGYTADQLRLAIDGCAKTPHNIGQNDRGERYDDLELICRDGPHVDRFIRNATSPPTRAGGARDFSKGMVRAQDVDQNSLKTVGKVSGF